MRMPSLRVFADVLFSLAWLVRCRMHRLWAWVVRPFQFMSDAGAVFWMLRAWIRQSGRAIASGPTTTVSLALALLAVAVPIYDYSGALQPTTLGQAISVGLSFLGIVALSTLAVARWTVAKLPPSQAAQIMISGLKVSDMLRTLAYELHAVASRFSEHPGTRYLLRYPRPEHNPPSVTAYKRAVTKDYWRLETVRRDLESYMLGQQRPLQRLTEMKRLAADELGIPTRRLCDHVMRFSPQMFQDRVGKFLSNWAELLTLARDGSVILSGERTLGLLDENSHLCKKIDRRCDHLVDLFHFADLHPFIHHFAAIHSASGSLRAYGRALSVAPQGSVDPFFRVRLLLRTQRAHPGFDLHQHVVHLCERASRLGLPSKRSEAAAKQEVALRYFGDRETNSQSVQDRDDDHYRVLGELFGTIDAAVQASRDQIVKAMLQREHELFPVNEKQGEELLIVTHGYSKTVREVIKKAFFRTGKLRAAHDKLFLIGSTEEESPEAFDTRLMAYELKAAAPVDEKNRKRLPISAGEDALLMQLVRPGTHVLILLGAEAFGGDRSVVHPRGATQEIEMIKGKLLARGLSCKVVVVAEGYKFHEDLLADRAFFEDHLDRISIYPPGLVDRVVSDDAVGVL